MAHITVPAEVTYATLTVGATPSTGPIAFGFSVFSKADLRVRVGETELTQAQFTFAGTAVDGGFDGGSVSLVSPVSNTKVTVWRDVVPERTSDFSPATFVRVADLDTLADRLTAMIQDVRRDVASALKLGVGEVYPLLPGPAERANGLFGFDGAGGPDFKQIGVDVQAFAQNLAALAGLASTANRVPYFTGSGAMDMAIITTAARNLLDDPDAATMRATLGLATVYQPLDATLTAFAGLSTAADKLVYSTGPDAFAMADLTAFGRTLLDDANASAARFTLGLTDGSDKIITSLLPALAITDTYTVANQAGMLALSAQRGDVAVRTDIDTSFILAGDDPAVLGNWTELLSPSAAGSVLQFNGRVGAVILNSGDVTGALGYTPASTGGNTFTGKQVMPASAAGGAGFNLAPGADPTAPVNGDFWPTATALRVRLNGATKDLAFTDSNITGSAASLTTSRNFSITGDGTASAVSFNGTGNVALNLTLANNAVTNTKLADMASGTVKANLSGATADPSDVTLAQLGAALTNIPPEALTYGVRAAVHWNGLSGQVAVRKGYNVASIVRNGLGDYTITFTTALPDANYSVVLTANDIATGNACIGKVLSTNGSDVVLKTTAQVRVGFGGGSGQAFDFSHLSCVILD